MEAEPVIGDFVGTTLTGADVFIVGVDREKRMVKIAEVGSDAPWIGESWARHVYNYTWGKKTALPLHLRKAFMALAEKQT